jgi:hypothetical protein
MTRSHGHRDLRDIDGCQVGLPIRALLRVRVAVPSQRYRAAIRIGSPPFG